VARCSARKQAYQECRQMFRFHVHGPSGTRFHPMYCHSSANSNQSGARSPGPSEPSMSGLFMHHSVGSHSRCPGGHRRSGGNRAMTREEPPVVQRILQDLGQNAEPRPALGRVSEFPVLRAIHHSQRSEARCVRLVKLPTAFRRSRPSLDLSDRFLSRTTGIRAAARA
jgi:hypothetical protein